MSKTHNFGRGTLSLIISDWVPSCRCYEDHRLTLWYSRLHKYMSAAENIQICTTASHPSTRNCLISDAIEAVRSLSAKRKTRIKCSQTPCHRVHTSTKKTTSDLLAMQHPHLAARSQSLVPIPVRRRRLDFSDIEQYHLVGCPGQTNGKGGLLGSAGQQ